jgi:hypothetical protein
MNFTHDFREDLDAIDFDGEPFALGRFADGERALVQMRPVPTADGWTVPPLPMPLTRRLGTALRADTEGWHIGISCPCCDRKAHKWYCSQVRLPARQLTYSNIFVNANHERFLEKIGPLHTLMDRFFLVSPNRDKANLTIAANAVNCLPPFNVDEFACQLLGARCPILLIAGPAGAAIAWTYWRLAAAKERQTIIDVGSALDPWIHGRRTRGYHNPDHPNRTQRCRWTLVNANC